MRVVLDSNVVLSGFFFAGVPGIILEGWHSGRFRLTLSPSVLAEYREAGAELESRYGGSEFQAFAALLALNADIVDAPPHLEDQVTCLIWKAGPANEGLHLTPRFARRR